MKRGMIWTSASAAAWVLISGQACAATFADLGGKTHGPHRVGAHAKQPTPVPEPEKWAMMGAGLTVVGALARRRLVKK